jgi:hypothetical protein
VQSQDPLFWGGRGSLAHLVSVYAPPGAFTASIGWYRAGAGTVARSLGEQPPGPGQRLAVPTTVLWPQHDPLFPRAWSGRLDGADGRDRDHFSFGITVSSLYRHGVRPWDERRSGRHLSLAG